jgi:hypothetical protein
VRLNATSAKRSTKAINAAIGEPENYETRHTFEVAFMLEEWLLVEQESPGKINNIKDVISLF